jgi:hypothetical protein
MYLFVLDIVHIKEKNLKIRYGSSNLPPNPPFIVW